MAFANYFLVFTLHHWLLR